MNRIFAVTKEQDRELIDLDFITITDKDMNDPENMGASAESIMKAKHLGYSNVTEYWNDWVEFNDGYIDLENTTLEEIEKQLDDEYFGYVDYPGYDNSITRDFKEYKY